MGNDLNNIKSLSNALNLASRAGELSESDRADIVPGLAEGVSQDLQQCAIKESKGPQYGSSFIAVCLNPNPEEVAEFVKLDEVFRQLPEQRALSIKGRFGDKFDTETLGCFTDTNKKEKFEVCIDQAYENAGRDRPLPPVEVDVADLDAVSIPNSRLLEVESSVLNYFLGDGGIVLLNARNPRSTIRKQIKLELDAKDVIPDGYPKASKDKIVLAMRDRIYDNTVPYLEREEKIYHYSSSNVSFDRWWNAGMMILERSLGTDLVGKHLSFPITPVFLGVVTPSVSRDDNGVLVADILFKLAALAPTHDALQLKLGQFSGESGVGGIIQRTIQPEQLIPGGYLYANDLTTAFRAPDNLLGALVVGTLDVGVQFQTVLAATLGEVRVGSYTPFPDNSGNIGGNLDDLINPPSDSGDIDDDSDENRGFVDIVAPQVSDPIKATNTMGIAAINVGANGAHQLSPVFSGDGLVARLGRGGTAASLGIGSTAFAVRGGMKIRESKPDTDYGQWGFPTLSEGLAGDPIANWNDTIGAQWQKALDLEFAGYSASILNGAYIGLSTEDFMPYASMAAGITFRQLTYGLGPRFDGESHYFDTMFQRLQRTNNPLVTSDLVKLLVNDTIDQYIYGRALTRLFLAAAETEDVGNIAVASATAVAVAGSRTAVHIKANELSNKNAKTAENFQWSATLGSGALVTGVVLESVSATRNDPGKKPGEPGLQLSDSSLGVKWRSHATQVGDGRSEQAVASFDLLRGTNLDLPGTSGPEIVPIASLSFSIQFFSGDE